MKQHRLAVHTNGIQIEFTLNASFMVYRHIEYPFFDGNRTYNVSKNQIPKYLWMFGIMHIDHADPAAFALEHIVSLRHIGNAFLHRNRECPSGQYRFREYHRGIRIGDINDLQPFITSGNIEQIALFPHPFCTKLTQRNDLLFGNGIIGLFGLGSKEHIDLPIRQIQAVIRFSVTQRVASPDNIFTRYLFGKDDKVTVPVGKRTIIAQNLRRVDP